MEDDVRTKRGHAMLCMALTVLVGLSLLYVSESEAQQRQTGYVFDSSAYIAMPYVSTSRRSDQVAMPPRYSLRKYAPPVGDQGNTHSCASWATAYAARSILAAIRHEQERRSGRPPVFSAFWVYNGINGGLRCDVGTTFDHNLSILMNGAETIKQYSEKCVSRVKPFYTNGNRANAILSCERLSLNYGTVDPVRIKIALLMQRPVVVGMKVTESIYTATRRWPPDRESLFAPSSGHAMTVVGYDDSKYGGAFEVMNSWGRKWGNNGFIWIPYSDMRMRCSEAYTLIERPRRHGGASAVSVDRGSSPSGMDVINPGPVGIVAGVPWSRDLTGLPDISITPRGTNARALNPASNGNLEIGAAASPMAFECSVLGTSFLYAYEWSAGRFVQVFPVEDMESALFYEGEPALTIPLKTAHPAGAAGQPILRLLIANRPLDSSAREAIMARWASATQVVPTLAKDAEIVLQTSKTDLSDYVVTITR